MALKSTARRPSAHAVKAAAEAVAHAFPPLPAILEWAVEAAISGVIGLLVGAASIPVVGFALRAGMEIAEALSAPPSEYVRSVKGLPLEHTRFRRVKPGS